MRSAFRWFGRNSGIVVLPLALMMSGCSSNFNPVLSPAQANVGAIKGLVHGGQQPLVGSQVYLYAAGTSGYGGSSRSLLTAYSSGSFPTQQDGNGNYYVVTDANGTFSLTGEYTCNMGDEVYLYAQGGNPGAGTNSAIGLLAILGQCPAGGSLAAQVPFLTVSEVSTVAAAYAMAGFATDATHVSDDEMVVSNTTAALAKTGMANAFANAANLVDIASATALAKTPGGNGTVPQATINTLANILASCVNATGPGSGGCPTLFSDMTINGNAPTDTATAAIHMAQNPGTHVSDLYYLQVATSPFAPSLGTAPNDLTISINFAATSLGQNNTIAIDALGNAWIADGTGVTEFSPLGVALSGTTGFRGNGLNSTSGVAIGPSGNAWAVSAQATDLVEISTTGSFLSGSSGYPITAGGYTIAVDASESEWISTHNKLEVYSGGSTPINLTYSAGAIASAIATSGNVWITTPSFVEEFTSAGVPVFTSPTGSTNGAGDIALDHAGNVWVGGDGFTKFSGSGTQYTSTAFTGGGVGQSNGISIDGAGNAWSTNLFASAIAEIGNSGAAVSPSTGYKVNNSGFPATLAADGSGNIWVADYYGPVTEFIGVAVPVVTPLAVGVKYNKLGMVP